MGVMSMPKTGPLIMKSMKKSLLLAVIYISGLASIPCFSQTITFSGSASPFVWIPDNNHPQLLFYADSTNHVLKVNSTNWFHCRLENRSTNQITFENAANISLIVLYSGTTAYLYKQSKQPEKKHLNVGQSYEWDQSLIIDPSRISGLDLSSNSNQLELNKIEIGQFYAIEVFAPCIDGITNCRAYVGIPTLKIEK